MFASYYFIVLSFKELSFFDRSIRYTRQNFRLRNYSANDFFKWARNPELMSELNFRAKRKFDLLIFSKSSKLSHLFIDSST